MSPGKAFTFANAPRQVGESQHIVVDRGCTGAVDVSLTYHSYVTHMQLSLNAIDMALCSL